MQRARNVMKPERLAADPKRAVSAKTPERLWPSQLPPDIPQRALYRLGKALGNSR
jgi:hypothetical protein